MMPPVDVAGLPPAMTVSLMSIAVPGLTALASPPRFPRETPRSSRATSSAPWRWARSRTRTSDVGPAARQKSSNGVKPASAAPPVPSRHYRPGAQPADIVAALNQAGGPRARAHRTRDGGRRVQASIPSRQPMTGWQESAGASPSHRHAPVTRQSVRQLTVVGQDPQGPAAKWRPTRRACAFDPTGALGGLGR